MKHQLIDEFAAQLKPETQAAVRFSAKGNHERSRKLLSDHYDDSDQLRALAGQIKQHTIEHLDRYLAQAEAALTAHGAKIHWAATAETACEQVLEILRARGATTLVKSKTMVSEEIELNPFLEKHGITPLETDLGEFIAQIDHDKPSHIVGPVIHKNRREIGRSFDRFGLGPYTDDPPTLTRRARQYLRNKYLQADAGLTGANFLIAESGRIVVATNEGNSRFCLAPTKVHIALIGIEKLLPRDRDLSLFLNLLGRSATGQPLTVYTEFIQGPKAPGQRDGPEELHVIFLDNGRTKALASECLDVLRCLRCGACLNVCPVYRQVGGHAYRTVYSGPIGSVLSPIMKGDGFAEFADLPKACSVCGACKEVCPVNMPLPDMLLRLRDRAKQESIASPGTPPMGAWAMSATNPTLWRAGLLGGSLLDHVPTSLIPVPALHTWVSTHTMPPWRGGKLRSWLKQRKKEKTT